MKASTWLESKIYSGQCPILRPVDVVLSSGFYRDVRTLQSSVSDDLSTWNIGTFRLMLRAFSAYSRIGGPVIPVPGLVRIRWEMCWSHFKGEGLWHRYIRFRYASKATGTTQFFPFKIGFRAVWEEKERNWPSFGSNRGKISENGCLTWQGGLWIGPVGRTSWVGSRNFYGYTQGPLGLGRNILFFGENRISWD